MYIASPPTTANSPPTARRRRMSAAQVCSLILFFDIHTLYHKVIYVSLSTRILAGRCFDEDQSVVCVCNDSRDGNRQPAESRRTFSGPRSRGARLRRRGDWRRRSVAERRDGQAAAAGRDLAPPANADAGA